MSTSTTKAAEQVLLLCRLAADTGARRGELAALQLGHWFSQLCEAAGMPEVTLHRLRHTVATVLVGRGQILQAQYRLGHADAYTTLRIYSHAQPLQDLDAADTLDELYRT